MIVMAANQNGGGESFAKITETFKTLIFQQYSLKEFAITTVWLEARNGEMVMTEKLHAALPHPECPPPLPPKYGPDPKPKPTHLSIIK